MTIASEITKLNTNLGAAYTAVDSKGGTLPQAQNFDNLATAISSIPSGGGGGGETDYATILQIENTIKGTSYVQADVEAEACDDISYFLYGTANS